jgi:hypothetical protein
MFIFFPYYGATATSPLTVALTFSAKEHSALANFSIIPVRMTLTFSDWCLLIGTVAAVIAAIYAILAYHRPKRQAVDNLPQSASVPSRRRSITPIAMALIAWGAVASRMEVPLGGQLYFWIERT